MTSDRYWCDHCQDYFDGSAAIIHKGARCYFRARPESTTSPA